MKFTRKCNARAKKGIHRRGSATIEAAVTAPILVFIAIGAIDLAQYINVAQTICNASRVGARSTARSNVDDSEQVKTVVENYIESAFPNTDPAVLSESLVIEIKDADGLLIEGQDLGLVAGGTILYVNVDFDFTSIRWFSVLDYWNSELTQSVSVTRRE